MSYAALNYQEAVKNSLLKVEDILGSFDALPRTSPARTAQPAAPEPAPPKTNATKSKKKLDIDDIFEELEQQLYSSGGSPPHSPSASVSSGLSSSESDLEEKRRHSSQDDDSSTRQQSGLEAPRMLRAKFEAEHGIEVSTTYTCTTYTCACTTNTCTCTAYMFHCFFCMYLFLAADYVKINSYFNKETYFHLKTLQAFI